jgi:uncharacterized DUF497 family protein
VGGIRRPKGPFGKSRCTIAASADAAGFRCTGSCSQDHLDLDSLFIAYAIIPVSHDPAKRHKSLRKHGIDLPVCMDAFDAPMLTREDDRGDYGEQRFVSIGWAHGRMVVLVWTERDDGPRLISCREAEPHEREAYFKACPLH